MKMGSAYSKTEKNEALRLCRERKRFIKLAIDSRYALVASHVSYIHSLQNVGVALRRYAEAEVLKDSSLSVSDKTPSHSTYPSSSPSHVGDVSESPLHSENHTRFMRSSGTEAVAVRINPSSENYMDDESMGFPIPPPPPENGASWDFFYPCVDSESSGFEGHASYSRECNHEELDSHGHCKKSNLDEKVGARGNDYRDLYVRCSDQLFVSRVVEGCKQMVDREVGQQESLCDVADKGVVGGLSSKDEKNVAVKNVCTEREDPSEFITHRAKDFLSSIKDIEHRFVRAFESGREVARLLEANKIKVGYCEVKGKSSAMALLTAFQHVCFRGRATPVSQEPAQKIICWKWIVSSQSPSYRNSLVTTCKEDMDDSGSEFVEESCMIAGSHSCTLDRLYAWERKLYDEVKASESIRKEYDRKCDKLRHQFAKDQGTQVIDKTRSVVKDLHSRIIVAIYSFDSISKRIERMRDEELFPQLLELTQGLIRMWKAMLECHHAQYITMSLAYHSRSSTGSLEGYARREILAHLSEEFECFSLSFANWINSHTSYVEALNGWLQNCILQPRERSKSRRPFSPRRVLAPSIFVLCRDWSAGIKALPSEELSHAMKNFLSDLHHLMELQDKQLHGKQNPAIASTGETASQINEDIEDNSSNLCCIQASLTKVLYQLTKFSEASLKMYEDIRQKSEAAQTAYQNCKSIRTGKF